MGKYYIDEAKIGILEVGPGVSHVIAAVHVTENDKGYWFTNIEVEGMPELYVTQEDLYESIMSEVEPDEDFDEFLATQTLKEFAGICVAGYYEDVYANLAEQPDNPAVSLIKYVILLTRCALEEEAECIALGKGKYIDEVEIPRTDVE